jgi:uncharacterized protein (TIGR03435 family)
MRQTTIACALACVLCATVSVPAQSPQAPAFEVASVRMAGAGPLTSRITDTRVDISQPMISILSTAFRADARRLVVPDLNDAYVEIRATVPAGATRQQVPEMLQRLLVERFGLVWHRELRLTDGYALIVGPGGVKMRQVEPLNELQKEFPPEPSSAGRGRNDITRETSQGTTRTVSIPGGTRWITSRTMYEEIGNRVGGVTINAIRMTMAELLPRLESTVDQPIVDRTGLTGLYQFTLDLPPDATIERLRRQLPLPDGTLPQPSFTAPTGAVSVLKTIEGLGLRLERTRVPMEVVIVDKIARTPTER